MPLGQQRVLGLPTTFAFLVGLLQTDTLSSLALYSFEKLDALVLQSFATLLHGLEG